MPTAVITDIMDSWPLGLRLRVVGEATEILVDLAEDCRIVHEGDRLSPNELRCGMTVRIEAGQRVLRQLEVITIAP